MKEEKIIEKIKKVLELSRNNPSKEEAEAAALKAQRLMCQYHISMAEVDNINDMENIVENQVEVGVGNKWKYTLANIVSKNFRCKNFFYGKSIVAFYGYETDVEIAKETFSFLFETGRKAANNYYMKLRNEALANNFYFNGSGVKNSFLVGYLQGISDSLDKQCTALMITIPKEVKESYSEISKNFRTMACKQLNTRGYYSNKSREEGYQTGRNTINNKQLAMA